MTTHQHVVAAADLGSNTVKITVAAVDGYGAIEELLDGAETIRLGAGIERTGRIEPARIEQCLDVLTDYERRGREMGAVTFIGVATEALRVARNGDELLSRIERESAWRIRIISGDEEARLTFVGLRDRVPSTGTTVIVDVGGGSTELIRASKGEMRDRTSVPVGSGRLADRFFTSDPPSPEALDEAVASAIAALTTNPLLRGVDQIVLSGGNGVFLADLARQLFAEDEVSATTLERLMARFATEPAAVNAARLGIAHERARVLPAGGAIALAILRISRPSMVLCVPSGIRIGLIREWLANACRQ